MKKQAADSRGKKTTTIRLHEFIPAPPEEVYDAYLDAKKQSDCTGARTACERYVGGKFSAWNGYITGTNLKLENARRIVQEWKTAEWPNGYGPSVLEFTFQRKRNGTEVHITQSAVPADQAKYYKKGWAEFYSLPMKNFFKSAR